MFIAVVSSWARREALDTSQFGRTSRQALTDPKVREALALSVVDAVYRRVDVEGEIRRVLPPAASGAAAPAASAIRLYGPRAIEELIKVPFVLSALVQASELLQRWALDVVDGDPAPERNAYLAARPLLLLAAAQAGVERDVATALPADPREPPAVPPDRGAATRDLAPEDRVRCSDAHRARPLRRRTRARGRPAEEDRGVDRPERRGRAESR